MYSNVNFNPSSSIQLLSLASLFRQVYKILATRRNYAKFKLGYSQVISCVGKYWIKVSKTTKEAYDKEIYKTNEEHGHG